MHLKHCLHALRCLRASRRVTTPRPIAAERSQREFRARPASETYCQTEAFRTVHSASKTFRQNSVAGVYTSVNGRSASLRQKKQSIDCRRSSVCGHIPQRSRGVLDPEILGDHQHTRVGDRRLHVKIRRTLSQAKVWPYKHAVQRPQMFNPIGLIDWSVILATVRVDSGHSTV